MNKTAEQKWPIMVKIATAARTEKSKQDTNWKPFFKAEQVPLGNKFSGKQKSHRDPNPKPEIYAWVYTLMWKKPQQNTMFISSCSALIPGQLPAFRITTGPVWTQLSPLASQASIQDLLSSMAYTRSVSVCVCVLENKSVFISLNVSTSLGHRKASYIHCERKTTCRQHGSQTSAL